MKVSKSFFVYGAMVLCCHGVDAMSAFVLDSSIDARSLRLGRYESQVTIKAILRAQEVVETIDGFDNTKVGRLCEFLTYTNSHISELSDEQVCAFKIYLEQLAFGVPGESKLAEGKLRVIALANVLAGYSESVEDFKEKRNLGNL